ncbi:MAG: aminomethyl transferase family protein [Phycisphaerales bacterium]|nr:hypothetical protein [Phycisphaerae bacterium]NNF43780.1 aminomethyl transferase family protein [Phycisphaerales bacterium]NNM27780.1 aminomethyl transferase family protein [Phycisphaerales bacterium]
MMLYDTPLRKLHDAYRPPLPAAAVGADRPGAARGTRRAGPTVEYISYGPPDDDGLIQCEIPATFGSLELEYAALRRGAGVIDAPHRATLRVSGADRLAFLDSMLTQSVASMATGDVRHAFWLNRTGRIESDVRLVATTDAILVDVDVHQASSTVESLAGYVFTEDVEIADLTPEWHRLSIHGPAAATRLADVTGEPALATLDDRTALECRSASTPLVVARVDETGDPGFTLFVPRDAAGGLWQGLLAEDADDPVRPAGWFAYNIARIEGGTALMNVDYGIKNLPHESRVLDDRVSFTKGCYLGQEIVARMQNLGRPKQILVGFRVSGAGLPVAGGQVFGADGVDPIGVVTSSTLSPLRSAQPIGFAMIKSAHADPDTAVRVSAEGELVDAVVTTLDHGRDAGPDAAASQA